jgi:hypothetical protein
VIAGWVCVLRAPTLMQAHVALGSLRAGGIDAQAVGEALSGLAGAIPIGDAYVEVWVASADEDAARAMLYGPVTDGHLSLAPTDRGHGHLSPAPPAGALSPPPTGPEPEPRRSSAPEEPEEQCPECGAPWEPGFQVCWRCEHALS